MLYHTHLSDLEVKVTDLEILCQKYLGLKFLKSISFEYTTQTLISIKTLFLIIGHIGNLTPELFL